MQADRSAAGRRHLTTLNNFGRSRLAGCTHTFGQLQTYSANKNSNPRIAKYQLKGPETYSQRKVSSSGGTNSRKRKAVTHWVHFSNLSSIPCNLINSLMVLRRVIHIKHNVISKITYNSCRFRKEKRRPEGRHEESKSVLIFHHIMDR